MFDWYRIPVQVKRLTGVGAKGKITAAAVTELAWVDDTRQMVRDIDGNEVLSETTVYLPLTVADVPLGSLVTLPASFGGRQSTVLAVSRRDSYGAGSLAEHVELALR